MSQAAPEVRAGGGRILLICPKFFSYHKKISAALTELGFEVEWWDDRPSHATLYKYMLRRLPRLTGAISAASFRRQAEKVRNCDFSHVLVVKGEALSRKIVIELKELFPRARFSLYFWDAVENAPNAQAAADLFDHVATFDPADAARYGWRYRPLFADVPTPSASAEPDYDWSFVGTIHSDRNRVIQKLRASSEGNGRTYVFGYFPSKLLWLLHVARDWSLLSPAAATISTEPLPAEEVNRVTSASVAVLDVEHPRQKGLTIRTIETLLAGRKLITTNANIQGSRLFHPSRVRIIERTKPAVPSAFFEEKFKPLPEDVRYAYSTRCWAIEMLGMKPEIAHDGF